MKLRKWQSDCGALALKKYKTKQHFLCLACPGAGKTIMAANVAQQLLVEGLVDFVLCFSPSVTVAQGIQETFSDLLDCSFEGEMGDIGGSYTYQGMLNRNDSFWNLLKKHRVFVVLDEIHHCAGATIENANSWGAKVLSEIQNHAAYTLALTGTPWRSDKISIAMTKYSDESGYIHCDYIYGLANAISEGVCRVPKIVLIDSTELTLKKGSKVEVFESFEELLKSKSVSYQSIITQREVMRHMLEKAASKLKHIRQTNQAAGGLIVASSVKHAIQLQGMLTNEIGQPAEIVTYKNQHAQKIIKRFRHSSTPWIVSVGMISEGTDIPRLQVCCHLSTTKTELYYRQVLGRIIRKTNAINQEAWLFTIAESNLTQFAERIVEDIPVEHGVSLETIRINETFSNEDIIDSNLDIKPTLNTCSEPPSRLQGFQLCSGDGVNIDSTFLLNGFRERLISHF